MSSSFNIQHEYILEDNFALLKPLKKIDFEQLKVFSMNEPELWQFSLQNAGSEEGMKQYISDALSSKEKEMAYP